MISPLISIITVVYNSETLIRGTIDSILAQTCQNFELIIVDGASTDNTLNIIKSYGDQISKCISEPDRGIYDAMNKGLGLAAGEYVWFINSGDKIYSNDVVGKIENIYTTNNPDVFYGETMLVNDNYDEVGLRSLMTTRKLPHHLTWRNMINGMVVSHQSVIVRREKATMYNLQYHCSADIEWVIMSLKDALLIINTRMILSSYLVGGFSIANKKRCLKERFDIYINHYGLIRTMYAHIKLIYRNLMLVFSGNKNY